MAEAKQPDLRKMGPTELVRLLNSTPLGPVIKLGELGRDRDVAGMRVGTGRTVDLVRYAAWLIVESHKPKEAIRDVYERAKERARKKSEELYLSGRDIAPLPTVINPGRRDSAERDFRQFCNLYFPKSFTLPWSADHLKVIGQIEESVLKGGLFATAMPRGSGKTTLAECACIWAVLYGHRDFIALIGSDEGHAEQMLDSIKAELDNNDILAEDFPEACYPITCLEGISNRCSGQLCNGERTQIGWTSQEVILPTIAGSKASGAIIKVCGLTGGIRGMKFKRPDGRTVRPSLVVIDDPQTDQSANSRSQCEARERILAGAILGLAGPGKKIAGIMPCTVIRLGDMADRILDRALHPEWNGTRTKMVYSFPSAEALWNRYAEILGESLRAGRGFVDATEFYRENRDAMDAGAVVAWPARHNYDEISAIQHAMNLKIRDERAFFSEYQNEPLPEVSLRSDDLSPDQIATKINRIPRFLVPAACNRLTGFIDVQGSMLFYVVTAWEDDFTGYVVDYGSFPDQKRAYFTLRDAKNTLESAISGTSGLEGLLYGGLERLCGQILGRDWLRDDGAGLKVERCLIDANWGASTAVVKQFCRQSAHVAALSPSHGKYVGASSTPMAEWPVKPGERHGLNWRIRSMEGSKSVRSVLYDSNYWKSFVQSRLGTAMGDRGCLSLFGDKPAEHRLFADHLTAEYRVRTFGRGREVDEWKIRPERPDNHYLDCLAGCAVAASIQGVSLPETVTKSAPKAKTSNSFEEFKRRQAERKANRARMI